MIVQDLDWREPYAAFAPLTGEAHAHLLHGGDRAHNADWSIIAAFPKCVLEIGADDAGDPFGQLQALISERKIDDCARPAGAPFVSGIIGYAGYEMARFVEPSLSLPASPFALPDMVFGVYDAAAVFSRKTRRAFLVGREETACIRLAAALGNDAPQRSVLPEYRQITSNFTARQYEAGVRSVIEDISNGDYYQANISHQFSIETSGEFNAFSLFRRLAGESDAFYGALLQYPDGAILSNSPERFFCVTQGEGGARRIVTEPIKGTRPRGAAALDDLALAQELLNDPKDRAENIMIADLMRNDLSKICCDGSIQEEAICELMSLANVHHLLSRISGELRDDVRFSDIFSALFPCGSITGAPKIEAMNAIAKTEQIGRGPYCGAIGYIDDSGAAEFSVAIRAMMVTKNNKRLTIPVGGGVTLRSDPYQEYQETLTKAHSALEAAGKSHRDAS